MAIKVGELSKDKKLSVPKPTARGYSLTKYKAIIMPRIPFKKGEKRTKEIGRKGGRRSTPKKTFANALKNRKWCTPGCVLFGSCPFASLSQRPEEEKGFGGKCGLKQMPIKTQRRVVDILTKGSQGLVDEMSRVLLDMGIESDTTRSLKGKAIFFDKIKDLHELLYGKLIKQDINTEQKITVQWKRPDDDKDTED